MLSYCMLSLCVCVKLLYVKFVYVKFVCVKLLYVKFVYVKLLCKEAGGAGGGEGARDTESKTRTPDKVVGKKRRNFYVLKKAKSLCNYISPCCRTLLISP